MKKVKEKDVRILEGFCVMTAVIAGVLCVLYLFDLLQNHWFLNFILGLGVLLHVSLTLLFLIRKKRILTASSVVLLVFYIVSLIYFNI
ncbi:MAG: hypothetical protein Q4C61_14390 [Lachnospiraceae bacterium]|nr:hypothetical protein [Lachnospiraceae bacterium]